MIYLLTCGGAGTPGGGAGSASEFGVRARKTTRSPPLDRRWPTKRPTGPNNLLFYIETLGLKMCHRVGPKKD